MPFNINVLERNNVKVTGNGETTLMLAHGFGCDQNMWRFMLPTLESNYKVVLFDYVGCGQSDTSAFDKKGTSHLMAMHKMLLKFAKS